MKQLHRFLRRFLLLGNAPVAFAGPPAIYARFKHLIRIPGHPFILRITVQTLESMKGYILENCLPIKSLS